MTEQMLAAHMPELVPTWQRLVDLADGDPLAAQMLTLYNAPPFLAGCSQAVYLGSEPALVRNYDYAPVFVSPDSEPVFLDSPIATNLEPEPGSPATAPHSRERQALLASLVHQPGLGLDGLVARTASSASPRRAALTGGRRAPGCGRRTRTA
jgi:hypothetical protein